MKKGKDSLTLISDGIGFVTALTSEGVTLWKTKMPSSETVHIISRTYGRSMVRAIECGDLNGDGREEVVIGLTDNYLYCLSDEGEIL